MRTRFLFHKGRRFDLMALLWGRLNAVLLASYRRLYGAVGDLARARLRSLRHWSRRHAVLQGDNLTSAGSSFVPHASLAGQHHTHGEREISLKGRLFPERPRR
jgi:hypothetical protein